MKKTHPEINIFTIKQQKFIILYVGSGRAAQSAIDAGYSAKSAGQMANELLRDPKIAAEIRKEMDYIRDQHRAKLLSVVDIAIDALINTADQDKNAMAKVMAANSILDRAGLTVENKINATVQADITTKSEINITDDARQKLFNKLSQITQS